MSAPVWRQLDRGRVQHVEIIAHPDAPERRALLCQPWAAWFVQCLLHDRPDLPKCRRCLAALERRGE